MINIEQKLEDCIKTNTELIESMIFVNDEYTTPHNKRVMKNEINSITFSD
jgi:hypothetical protein